jgi:protein-S-isoprenylcysteine O-methyltransferase Ste14
MDLVRLRRIEIVTMADADLRELVLQQVQWRRKRELLMAVGTAVAALAFVSSYWRGSWPAFYEAIEWAGIILILICIAGRTWCTAYIGGRKKRELVTTGPYSVVRNPLYVFTLIGAVGVGFQFGSLVVGAIVPAATYLVFRPVVMQEEAYLAASFPDEFRQYSTRVQRLWPNVSKWRGEVAIVMPVRVMLRTFVEACLFLTAIPIAEGIEALQARDVIPALVMLV